MDDNFKTKKGVEKKYGHVIRTGDVLKFGKFYMIIRESSVDINKIQKRKLEEMKSEKQTMNAKSETMATF